MDYRFLHDTPLRWSDIDSERVLHHAKYLELVEQARYAYFVELGLVRHGDRVPFLIGEIAGRFERPGHLGMSLVTAVRISRLGNRSFDMEYEVRDRRDRLATFQSRLVWVDGEQRSCEIPAAARARIAAFEQIPERTPAG